MATTTIDTTIEIKPTVKLTDTSGNAIIDTYAFGLNGINEYVKTPAYDASGGASKIKLSYHAQLSVTTNNLVLTDGSLLTRFGAAIAFTKIKIFLLRIVTPTTGVYITVGNATQPAQLWQSTAANTDVVRSCLYHENLIDGWSLTAGDTLKLVASAGTITADLYLAGE